MSALLASLAGVGLALGVAVPLATLAVLGWFRRTRHANAPIERRGSTTALLLLLAPSLGALLWLVSAALHLAEPGGAHAFCALDHGELETCVDALLFAGLLTGVMAASVGYRATRPRGELRGSGWLDDLRQVSDSSMCRWSDLNRISSLMNCLTSQSSNSGWVGCRPVCPKLFGFPAIP